MSAPEYTDIWPLIQQDILGVLKADAFIGARPGLQVEPGEIQSVIDTKLTKAIGKGNDGKSGVGFLVLPIEKVEDEDLSNPFGPYKLTITIQFVENVTINHGLNGTKIPIRIFAARCAKVLKLYTPVGLTQNLVARNPVISEFTDNTDQSRRVGQVEFTAREADAVPLIRLNGLRLAVAGGRQVDSLNWRLEAGAAIVTITSPDVETEEIYYTTDGTHPYSANKTARLYDGPVTVTEACLFRARAFADGAGRIGSNTAAVNFITP